ncbi:MAG: PLP-dependent transferase, partial [Candidatus Zixiibacteriota bacterium]
MSSKNKLGFNSLAVHAGYHVQAGPVNPPVERSSTYIFDNCEDGAERFASAEKKGIYSRLHNPNCDALEKKIAAIEGGFGAIATASGMAAVEAAYFAFLDSSSHVVATNSVYGPSRSILEKDMFYKKWGVSSTFLDTSNIDAVRKAARTPNTRLIFLETPANPTLAITDIA